MKTNLKAVERQKRYEDSKRAKGFVRVILWVPENKRQQLKDYARGLNNEKSR